MTVSGLLICTSSPLHLSHPALQPPSLLTVADLFPVPVSLFSVVLVHFFGSLRARVSESIRYQGFSVLTHFPWCDTPQSLCVIADGGK